MRVVVASSDLGLSTEIISKVAADFSIAPPDEAYGIRMPLLEDTVPSVVEMLVARLAKRLGRDILYFSPTHGGRAAVYRRDYNMMEGASSLLAFFSPGREMDGGTGHVVKAALDRGVRVEAYAVQPDGTLDYLGSDDPDHKFSETPNVVLERMWRESQHA